MTTATLHELPQLDPTDAMINRTVRALMAIRDMTPPELWAAADLSKATYYNRMRGRRGSWTAPELQRVASALGVSVATLFEGLGLPSVAGAGFEPATSGTRAQVIDLAARRALRRSGEPAAIGVAVGQ